MAMAHGNDGKVYDDATQIGHVQSWTYDENIDVVDGSGMGDTSRSYYTGINDGNGTVVMNWNPADAGQPNIDIGYSMTLKLYPEGNASADTYWSGTAVVESISWGGAKEGGMVSMSFSFRGKLTEAVVT